MKPLSTIGELYVYCPSDKFLEFARGQYPFCLIHEPACPAGKPACRTGRNELLLKNYRWNSYTGNIGLLVMFDGSIVI